MSRAKRFEWLVGAGLLLLSVSHWFPLGFNLLELLVAFAHFTLVLSLVCVLLAAIKKLRILLLSASISAITSGVLVVPHMLHASYSGEADFTVGQFNLWHYNPSPREAINAISKATPDIFTIQELNQEWSSITDSAFSVSHPYTVEAPMESCCYGIGLYSRFPLVSYNVLEIGRTPVIIAQMRIDSRILTVVSLHTRPPAFPNETKERNLQLEQVASIVAAENSGCIAMGDFNVVPWDATFTSFLSQGNLIPVRDEFQPTYPMDLGIPLIPIDHITYKGRLEPTECRTVNLPGSDHVGLVAGFEFKE